MRVYTSRKLEIHFKNRDVKTVPLSEKCLLEYHKDFSSKKEFENYYGFSPDEIKKIVYQPAKILND